MTALRLAVALAALLSSPSVRATPSAPPPERAAAAPAGVRPAPAERKLRALVSAEWEDRLRENPILATIVGDRRYDDQIPDLSRAAIARRFAAERRFLAEARKIDRARLAGADRVTLDLFIWELSARVEAQRFPEELLAIDQLDGLQTALPMVAQLAPKLAGRDYENLVERLRKTPVAVDQTIALLEEGLAKGVTPAQIALAGLPESVRALAEGAPEESAIFQEGFTRFPPELPAAERARLREAGAKAIAEAVQPAMKRLHAFLAERYVPGTRKTLGMSALPDGEAWYAFRARRSTTTKLSPEEIHRIGLAEVKRIRARMEETREAAGFQGDLAAFFRFLRTDPQFVFRSRDELLVAYRDSAKRLDAEVPRLFRVMPRLPYGISPELPNAEKTAPGARYQHGSLETGRPGMVFVNTYAVETRPRWEVDAIAAHEGVPGHHFQLAVAQEQGDLPPFRRFGHYTAFIEGWGLYAERLAEELGIYRDPYALMGRHGAEVFRAVRLVLDTGIHAKGWSREQAIAYFEENVPMNRHDIEVEVDRYIAWPGQALGYKLGELELVRLREKATVALGARFDVRAFHDLILTGGAMPLDVLAARVDEWIARTGAGAKVTAATR